MLNIFRQKQHLVRIVLGFILALVCLSMVVTLIPGIITDTGDSPNNPVVAEVAGDRITSAEVQQSVQQVSQRNRIPSEMMPFYTNQILNEMILEKASVSEANRMGLAVGESELLALLRQDPNLFPNGNFIGQEQYEDLISERFGMNVAQFEERYRRAMLLDRLRQLVTDSLTVAPEEIHKAFVSENEKVVLDYVFFNPPDLKKDISNPSDSVLEDYYKKNKDHYQVAEKRSAKILLVLRQKVREATSVSDSEVKKYYQDHIDNYRLQEQVTVSHILLKADPKDAGKMAEARKKAEDLLKQLKAGADFAAMAKQYSDDKATAPSGGVLAGVVRKQTEPEFEKVAFSLAPGAIGDPVQTAYGIHIIKVISHDQPRLKPLEEVKLLIQTVVLEEKANKAVANEADQAAAALRSSPADIAAVAGKYHGEVLAPPPFAQTETLPRIGGTPPFMQQVFGLEKGKAGSPVQVPEGYAIPVLLDVLPPHPGEYAEVKDQVKNEYIEEQAKVLALSKAKELAKILEKQDKKDLKIAAANLKLTVKTSLPVTRDGTIPSLGSVRDLDPKTFMMPVGGIAGPMSIGGGQVVYQVESREPPKEEELAGKKAEIQERLLTQKRQVAFEVFQDSLKSKLIASGRLKIHQDALAQLTTPGGSKP